MRHGNLHRGAWPPCGGTAEVVGPGAAASEWFAGTSVAAALLPEAGVALIPGVDEVVITGALACAAGYYADKAGTWVWDHRSAIARTAKHVVHDLEPWNW